MAELKHIVEGDTRLLPSTSNQTAGYILRLNSSLSPEWGENEGANVSWSDINDKPSTFTPSTHTHSQYANAITTGSLSTDSSLDDVISKINTLIAELKG